MALNVISREKIVYKEVIFRGCFTIHNLLFSFGMIDWYTPCKNIKGGVFQLHMPTSPYQPTKNSRSGCTPVESCYTTIHFYLSFCGTVCILNIVKLFVCKRRIPFIIILVLFDRVIFCAINDCTCDVCTSMPHKSAQL